MLMKTRKAMLAAAVALTAGAVGFTGIAPSYAGAMNSAAPVNSGYQSGDLMHQVAKKKYNKKYNKKRWSYNRHRDGKRYRYKRSGYSYYYGGWWYPRPYWRQPGIYLQFNL